MLPFPSMSLPLSGFSECVSASSTGQCPDQNAEAESLKKKKKNLKEIREKKKNYHESLCFRLPCGLEVSSSLGLAKGVQSCELGKQF